MYVRSGFWQFPLSDTISESKESSEVMDVFDIIGPVMIGPSSSHTAGACRLGRVANKLMDGRTPSRCDIILSGSFSRTGRGHGTDRAIVGGIMGFETDDTRIRDALDIAKAEGIEINFIHQDIPNAHPNTARITYYLPDGRSGFMQGASVGGGNIRIDIINGMEVKFSGDKETILVLHRDVPGVIANVTNLMHLMYSDINIGAFQLSRREKGGEALMTIEADSVPPEKITADIRQTPDVLNCLLIHKI